MFKTDEQHYAIFHSVMVKGNHLRFYLPDHLADGPVDDQHRIPDMAAYLQFQFWSNLSDFKVSHACMECRTGCAAQS